MNNQTFEAPEWHVYVNDGKATLTLGDNKRVITVTDLDWTEASELKYDIVRTFKAYSDPQRIDDYVLLAILESNSDLITDREIRVAIGEYYNDPAAMIKSAEAYCSYTKDGDMSELIGKDLVEEAMQYALAYHNGCGLTGEMYNYRKEPSVFDPPAGYYLTKVGHVLKQMMFGTAERVSI